ncbi:hypothetical protein [Methylobacter sp. YRD-M1]|uniref:hypothetical protein n=1 Tax=Methylobacter sp. YRD-M1 TaxID=2911520 RepID=UPI00227BD329|nr:hypothetical protein [Methylobacter sp. YRD-M1]WAK00409.1 hypothetical protein LZ558_11120 [Methylobacter sp. YRD-M1]
MWLIKHEFSVQEIFVIRQFVAIKFEARKMLKSYEAFTLCEIVWVLKRAYGYEKTVIINILRQLLVSREITVSSHSEGGIS